MLDSVAKEEFEEYLQSYLNESCDKMFEIAKHNCKNSYVDIISCEWYHSAWQYLRVLDKVSSPTWHFDFYYKEFNNILFDGIKILISGTADYSLLALIHFISQRRNLSTQIWVCDICYTPLAICNFYAERNGFKITTLHTDIKSIEKLKYFDLITTDAFLTRFSFIEKKTVVNKWNMLLCDKGSIVTSVRLDERFKQDERIQFVEKKHVFVQSVIESVNENNEFLNKKEKIEDLAACYISRIASMPFISEKEIEELFSECRFNILEKETVYVKGEITPTKYYRLSASKF